MKDGESHGRYGRYYSLMHSARSFAIVYHILIHAAANCSIKLCRLLAYLQAEQLLGAGRSASGARNVLLGVRTLR